MLVLGSAIVLQLAPPDSVPVDVACLLKFLQVVRLKLLKTICFESSNAIKRDVAIQPGCFVGSNGRVNSSYT